MSKVFFASSKMKALRADASLPAKFSRMLDQYPLKGMFEGKTVAIKVHLGNNLGYTTIPPIFIKMLVTKIKEAGGKPFVTDGGSAVPNAKDRGYTSEILGAPVVSAQGATGKFYVKVPINYQSLEDVELCGEVVTADAMIVFSHGKGHGICGWGGAIKNIAMGNVSYKSRGAIHALMSNEFQWDESLCTHCNLCADNCPVNAISFNDEGRLKIFDHHCRFCMHCVTACPQNAITIHKEGERIFQTGMAKVTKACLDAFEPNTLLFINHICNITPFCDCWGFTSPSIVPDVGIMASTDIVAVEQASIDSIKLENYIEGSLPHPLIVQDIEGHLLKKIHSKDPYLQCEEAETLGLGETKYELAEVD